MNILEAINKNIVDLSEDLVKMHTKIDELHSILFTQPDGTKTGNDSPSVGGGWQ